MAKAIEVGRIAFRHEGENWNAYWAPRHDSMAGAILMMSIQMSLVGDGGKLKDEFMALAKSAFSKIVQEATGQTPRWNKPQPAPEHERSGRS
jgi:hypothetical protein